jgi:hypothetical protein
MLTRPTEHKWDNTNRFLQKEKEDLDDVSNELELADEDARIP